MKKYYILGDSRKEPEDLPLFQDLNLDQLLEEIFKEEQEYCYEMPDSLEAVKYRQEVMQALEEKEVGDAVKSFIAGIRKAREYEENAVLLENGDGYANWHLKAAYTYYCALDDYMVFFEDRQQIPEGIQEVLTACRSMAEEAEYARNHDRAIRVYEKLSHLRYSIRIEKDCVTILPDREEDIISSLSEKFPMHIGKPERLPRLLPGKETTKLEQRIFSYLQKRNPGIFD